MDLDAALARQLQVLLRADYLHTHLEYSNGPLSVSGLSALRHYPQQSRRYDAYLSGMSRQRSSLGQDRLAYGHEEAPHQHNKHCCLDCKGLCSKQSW